MLLRQVDYHDDYRDQIRDLMFKLETHCFITDDFLDCLDCAAITYRKEYNLTVWVNPMNNQVEGFVAFIIEKGQLLVLDYLFTGPRHNGMFLRMGFLLQKRVEGLHCPSIGFMCVDEQEVVDFDDLGENDDKRFNHLLHNDFVPYSVDGFEIDLELEGIWHNNYFCKFEFTRACSVMP